MGVMVKEKLYKKVVEVRVSNRVIAVVLVIGEDVLSLMRLICGHVSQRERSF